MAEPEKKETSKEPKEKKGMTAMDILSKDKGEKTPKTPKAKESKKRVRMKHTHIEHHYDHEGKEAGHTVRHTPLEGGQEVSYASPDLDGVHDGLEEHVGEENAGESQEPPEDQEPPAVAEQKQQQQMV